MKLKGHKYNFAFISSFKMKPTKIGFKYLNYPILCHNKGSTNSDGGNYNNDDNNK